MCWSSILLLPVVCVCSWYGKWKRWKHGSNLQTLLIPSIYPQSYLKVPAIVNIFKWSLEWEQDGFILNSAVIILKMWKWTQGHYCPSLKFRLTANIYLCWGSGLCYGVKLNGDVVEQSRSKEYIGVRRFDLEGLRQSLNCLRFIVTDKGLWGQNVSLQFN